MKSEQDILSAKKVHIIGIGGIGTSAVARWYLAQGAEVSGSDLSENEMTKQLVEEGVNVKIGQVAENISKDMDVVIFSRAVPEDNAERVQARDFHLIEISYPEFLGSLAKTKKTIAVSGTNGKSTTTSMIAKVLIDTGLDPTVIVGSQVPDWPLHNLHLGKGEWFVVEACEYMASMLHIVPDIAVITNIEEDHLDYYRDIDHIRETFQEWIEQMDERGIVVVNRRDTQSKKLKIKHRHASDIMLREVHDGKQSFCLFDHGTCGLFEEKMHLSIPGEFNAMNASAATCAASSAGVDFEVIKKSLAEYKGIWRRFEYLGKKDGVDMYSDYAHHPTACEGTTRAFKEFFPDRRLVVFFQPHQYSRTEELFEDFVGAFDVADVSVIMSVYEVAGRNESHGVTSEDLVKAMKERDPDQNVRYGDGIQGLSERFKDIVQEGDVVVFMGAGDIDKYARKLIK